MTKYAVKSCLEMAAGFVNSRVSRVVVIAAIFFLCCFGLGLGISIKIAVDGGGEALAVIASVLLTMFAGGFSYFGREYLLTRNALRALQQEIVTACDNAKNHLERSDYEKVAERARGDLNYIPYVPWQPTQHELYQHVLQNLFLVDGPLIDVVQRAHDSEMVAEMFCTNLQSDIFKGMDGERRKGYISALANALDENVRYLSEARQHLAGHDLPRSILFSSSR